MTDQSAMSQQLSQMVEREVRLIIGDLQMQVLVLRQMLELAQPKPPQQPQQPQPQPQPPPQPGPQPAAAMNGRSYEVQ